MAIFKPIKIIDPFTGKERIVSPEEQEMMLMKGILFNLPSADKPENTSSNKSTPSPQEDGK